MNDIRYKVKVAITLGAAHYKTLVAHQEVAEGYPEGYSKAEMVGEVLAATLGAISSDVDDPWIMLAEAVMAFMPVKREDDTSPAIAAAVKEFETAADRLATAIRRSYLE